MKISDLLRMSLGNLSRRKGRTALTVIGVVVGTCAIVVMISLGLAMNANNEQMLASWGDLTAIQLYNYSYYGGSNGDAPKCNDETLAAIQAMPHVVCATPYYQADNLQGDVTAGKNGRYKLEYLYDLYGLYPNALEPMGFELIEGSFLTDTMQTPKDTIPVLVGQNFGYNFCDTRRSPNSSKYRIWQGMTDSMGNPIPAYVDPANDKLTLTLRYQPASGAEKTVTYKLQVVGVLATNYNVGYFTDSGLVMRLPDLEKLQAEYKKLSSDRSKTETNYREVHIKADSVDNVTTVENAIKEMGFETYSMSQIREEMQASVGRSQLMLGGLAAISLLVAALNIANTMTMAIYERTREIGVMKVLGCKLWSIRAMFLVESGCIGLLGGMIGVLLSLLISLILNHLTAIAMLFGTNVDLSGFINSMTGGWGGYGDTNAISIVPLWLILLALAFATVVGLLSGIAPAGRAVKISALEAIRRE